MTTRDLAREAHDAAEAHLAAAMRAFDAECEGDDDVEWPADMAGPFDGCDTCQIRETLAAAWSLLVAAALEHAGECPTRDTGCSCDPPF